MQGGILLVTVRCTALSAYCGAVKILRRVIVGIQLLFVAWIIKFLSAGSICAVSDFQDACKQGEEIGKNLGVMYIVLLWAIVDVLLGIAWLLAKSAAKKQPTALAPPAGMKTMRCARCTAIQNIPRADTSFECWQCKQKNKVVPRAAS